MCCLCNYICKWLDVQTFRIRTIHCMPRLLHLQSYKWSAGDVKELTGLCLKQGLTPFHGLTELSKKKFVYLNYFQHWVNFLVNMESLKAIIIHVYFGLLSAIAFSRQNKVNLRV